MKPLSAAGLLLAFACQALIIVGQLFLKAGMTPAKAGDAAASVPSALPPAVRNVTLGIVCMGVWFFLWLGLLNRWDISKLYPFEGLNPALMAIAAWIWLKEKLPVSAWIGLVLIGAGVAVVSVS